MRFKIKDNPVDGSIKITTKFLLFPKWIGLEFRWLEVATFKSVYYESVRNYERSKWYNEKWID